MSEQITHGINATNLADILERVLDKGIVIAGDIQIKLADVELLTIKIRLLISSVDKAKEMGIDWWEADHFLSTRARLSEIETGQEKVESAEKLRRSKIDTKQNKLKLSL